MLTWTLHSPTPESPKPGTFPDPTQAAMTSFLSVYGSYTKHAGDVDTVLGFVADIVTRVGYDRIARRIREALGSVRVLAPSHRQLNNILSVARVITYPKEKYPNTWDDYCQDPLLNDLVGALRYKAYKKRAIVSGQDDNENEFDNWHLVARHWE